MIIHPFNIKLNSKSTIGSALMRPLREEGILPRVVDVGARSGFFELPNNFTKQAEFIGFEPNQVEYDKLQRQNTDSILAGGRNAEFFIRKYYPTAIWSDSLQHDLNITVGPGSCTLSGDVVEALTRNMYQETLQNISFHERHHVVQRKEKVKCATLDSTLDDNKIIDYLKIDVEGGELEVLKGAEKLLLNKEILFIKTEFLLTPYYKNNVLLGDQQVYLNKMGYRLIDFDLLHLKYLRRPSMIPSEVDRRPRCAGDAFFMLDPDLIKLDGMSAHRLGIILFLFGYNSLAMSLFEDAKLLESEQIKKIEKALSKIPFHKRIKKIWCDFPYKIWPLFQSIGLFKNKSN